VIRTPSHILTVLGLCVIVSLWCTRTGRAAPTIDTSALEARLEKISAARPVKVPAGALDSIGYTITIIKRIRSSFPSQAQAWSSRAEEYLRFAEQGRDPFPEQKGRIVNRGYWSAVSQVRQGYAVYIPKQYDPTKTYPMMIVLHGGSSNGNLFLGVVLGNNMSWKRYPSYLWDSFTPRWFPDWIVVAPDGFGQVLWRYMGEQDVLDVMEDVKRHYSVDADRTVLCGLSNGGVGAYSLGMRHAWRFSAVIAMAGAPTWADYTGGSPSAWEKAAMRRISSPELAFNAFNTNFRMYHGKTDTGRMKPRFVQTFDAYLRAQNIPHSMTWYDLGHDILYPVHKHGRIYSTLENVRRDPKPKRVVLASGDYRANRQHWLTVTRIKNFPEVAHIEGTAEEGTVILRTRGARAVMVDLEATPLRASRRLRFVIDDQPVFDGPRGTVGRFFKAHQIGTSWKLGPPPEPKLGFEKKPMVSGPITDAYFGSMVHVYGTLKADDTEGLKTAAKRGAQGWPLWLWNVEQRVVSDTEVTPEMMQSNHLVLYATPDSHRLLKDMHAKLPIKLSTDGVQLNARTIHGKDLGMRYIFPNPVAPQRYVIVQAGTSTQAVAAGNRLPDFLPDYVVYDAASLRSRPRLIFPYAKRPLESGYFNDMWQLPPSAGQAQTTSEEPVNARVSKNDPAIKEAQRIAQRVPLFRNYRGEMPLGIWENDTASRWRIRSEAECLTAIKQLGIRAERVTHEFSTPVPTPMMLKGPVEGLSFRHLQKNSEVILSCEMLTRLPTLALILKRHGIRGVGVNSSYRKTPFTSFHTFGLALDMARFSSERGPLKVLTDFIMTPESKTCPAPNFANWRADTLAHIACELHESRVFSTVLTPNYNEGHRDHFHIDARPQDARFYVR